jgi:hypothetical protein
MFVKHDGVVQIPLSLLTGPAPLGRGAYFFKGVVKKIPIVAYRDFL